ncbi:N-acetyl-gamma-glutamyl-phosphate reductase [Jeotgalibacillus proteolyticus]|uniref:N-acetyl-gamma-glutamyl-phosphate reductase n=1 Tax=Jeotgalibacillus proteolyticus TaxID=2082395 RepID=A0A2S5G9V4_9BACL|nr:N-acetyl-gamma-glutamyl-phosphate reductase [Jeotgalibacillus proteolyticus]PPA69782.1 N-acetyl-gamma-glutamyl-phosphate reductase [Jeotgalibacillus proteolyticus]
MKVGIIGASGYGGLELIRLLHGHKEVESIDLFSSSEEGNIFSNKYAHLMNIYDTPLHKIDSGHLANLDVVFTSTPSGVSSKLLPSLIGKGPRLIDLSGDFRLPEREYEKWYKKEAAPTDALEESVYGLSEWNRVQIKEASLIANPGCYPTAVLLSLLPAVNNSLINTDNLIIDAKSGVSGAGNKPGQITHYSVANENLSIYKVNQHQHIPEIEQGLELFARKPQPITFSTHLVPMTRGILAASYAPLADGVTEQQLIDCYKETYKDEAFVRFNQDASPFGTNQVYGSNYCDIQIHVDPRTNRATIVAVIDNLVKGAAGQAIQNMNIQFDLDESTGLSVIPLFI